MTRNVGKRRTQRPPALFRVPESIDYLDGVIKPSTLRGMIFRGEIEVVRIGRTVCIKRETLDRLIREGTRPARPSRSGVFHARKTVTRK